MPVMALPATWPTAEPTATPPAVAAIWAIRPGWAGAAGATAAGAGAGAGAGALAGAAGARAGAGDPLLGIFALFLGLLVSDFEQGGNPAVQSARAQQ